MDFENTCYVCKEELKHAYQVKVITDTGKMHFVKCCSLEHAEMLKKENADMHKRRYKDVEAQCIQRLR